jgi:hypothetical protein
LQLFTELIALTPSVVHMNAMTLRGLCTLVPSSFIKSNTIFEMANILACSHTEPFSSVIIYCTTVSLCTCCPEAHCLHWESELTDLFPVVLFFEGRDRVYSRLPPDASFDQCGLRALLRNTHLV